MCQGGDYERNNGTGGRSIYGGKFEDENFELKHECGVLSMANTGRDTNQSQFFITLNTANDLDGKNVVFGKVISGMEVLKKIEKIGSVTGTPKEKAIIADCGQI